MSYYRRNYSFARITIFFVIIITSIFDCSYSYAAKDYRKMCVTEWWDTNNAVSNCSEAIRRTPSDAVLWLSRALAWKEVKEYDRALQDSNEALRLDPNNASAYLNKGNVYEAKENLDLARVNYNKYLLLEPSDPSAKNALDRVESKIKKLSKSKSTFGNISGIDDNSAYAIGAGFILISGVLIYVLIFNTKKNIKSKIDDSSSDAIIDLHPLTSQDNTITEHLNSAAETLEGNINKIVENDGESEDIDDLIQTLERLGDLKDRGIITIKEFEDEKNRILNM